MIIRQLPRSTYQKTLAEMQEFTNARRQKAQDNEIWLLEHEPVYTLGQAGRSEHILNAKNIPVVRSDRGGQVTYHAPGQLIGYILYDLKKAKCNVRQLVSRIENCLIDYLKHLDINAYARRDAPGVYVSSVSHTTAIDISNSHKIASLGLRVRHGYSYHGFALNVAMDLEPFKFINPCGYSDLQMCQCRQWQPGISIAQARQEIIPFLKEQFSATVHSTETI